MKETEVGKNLKKTKKLKLIFWIIFIIFLVIILVMAVRFVSKRPNLIGKTKKLLRAVNIVRKMDDNERARIMNWEAISKEITNKEMIDKAMSFNVTLTEGYQIKTKDTKAKGLSAENILNSAGWKAMSLFLSFNTNPAGDYSNKAVYFNGKNSYIKTPVNFKGCKALTISFRVKPERKASNELSVILDNGHDAKNNFAIQSADIKNPNNGIWAFHCNGIDILLTLPFNEWTKVVVCADAEKGIIQAYTNGIKVGEEKTAPFEFGSMPLTIGRLSKLEERYFKGSIDEIEIFDKVISAARK